MNYAMDRFYATVKQLLIGTGLVESQEIDLQVPKAATVQADLTLPCFPLARTRKTNPAQLASQIVATRPSVQSAPAGSDSLIGAVVAAGPYINFSLNAPMLASQVLDEIEELGGRYGHDDRGAGQTVVVDYSAPNIAKRMHVGHIRSTIIGQAVVNILRAQGYRVIGDNHLGDWGTQFGVLLATVSRWGWPAGEDEETIAQLESSYARYMSLAAQDPALEEEARTWSLRLEQGDPVARELWLQMVELTKRVNQHNYDRLGVHFDTEHGESFYASMTDEVIAQALASGVAYRDASGAVVVDVGGLPTFLLRRSDGGTLYITRDVATIRYREQTYHPAQVLYVVGQAQQLHFQQLFALARSLSYIRPEVALVHIPFGTVFDTTGTPLSTRRGNMVYLQSLLDEAVQRARALVEQKAAERGTELSSEERDRIAQAIGIGAVIYNDLYQDPKRNITLDWDRMLSTEGNSAAYLQYTYARCCSIVRRAGGLPARYDAVVLQHPAEATVIKGLAQLPLTVREAAAGYEPHRIADWLYTTARQFSAFYRDCPVLEAETPELRAARLHLVAAVGQGLKNGLALLGIWAPEQV